MFKELLNKQIEVRKKLNDFIEKNSVSEDEDNNVNGSTLNGLMNRNGGSMKTFKLETIEDVQYYQSLIDEEKELTEQVRIEYENYRLMQKRENIINKIRTNEKS